MKRTVLLVTISTLAIGSVALVVADQFSTLRLKAPKSCIEACGPAPKSGDYEAQVNYQMCIADCHPKIDDLQTQIDALEARVEALEQQQPGQCTEGEVRACSRTNPYGTCTGTETCVGGDWTPCTAPEPSAEVCDGLDNDCNPATNDGTDETWLGDLCDGPDADSCVEGIYECVAGVQTCSDDTGDDVEICGDGLDNDCDGSTDEGCGCTTGETAPCYTGPPGTEDIGVCTAGLQTCQQGEWGPCLGETTPTPEICGDGQDNDCDGDTDEGCPDTCTPDEAGSGRCAGDTLETCNGATWDLVQDCTAAGQICVSPAEGIAACVLPGGEIECTPGTTGFQRCAGDTVEVCDGAAWDLVTDCAAVGQTCVSLDPGIATCGAAQ